MEKMVEVERATQDELRQDLKSHPLTLEMVLEEELGRGGTRRDGPAEPGRRLARRRVATSAGVKKSMR